MYFYIKLYHIHQNSVNLYYKETQLTLTVVIAVSLILLCRVLKLFQWHEQLTGNTFGFDGK